MWRFPEQRTMYRTKWEWWSSQRNIDQAFNHSVEVKTSINSIPKLCQIARRMLLLESMEGSAKWGLYVAEYRIDPFECSKLDTFTSSVSYDGGVLTMGFTYANKTAQAIGNHVAFRFQTMLGVARNLCLAKSSSHGAIVSWGAYHQQFQQRRWR